ncbi:MAG: radical SAM protein, partial [Byssovorax sp.]
MKLVDRLGRPLASIRISVTDRCNLRCTYCMPEKEYVWLPRGDLLSFEEIVTLARVFAGLGVEKIRLTGGEP